MQTDTQVSSKLVIIVSGPQTQAQTIFAAQGNRELNIHYSTARSAIGLLMLVALLVACGGQPRQVSGEVPLISLDGLSLSDEVLELDIRFRNVNDSPLQLPALNLSLALDGEQVVEGSHQRPGVVVTARGREVVRLEIALEARGRQLLEELTRGERDSLAYLLDIEIEGRRRRQGETESRGFLHAVPGQPGRFR